MTRIIDKINAIRKRRAFDKQNKYDFDKATVNVQDQPYDNNADNNANNASSMPQEWYYSFEFFPPKTEAGLDNLLTRIDRMSTRLDPLFVDVTWGESGSTSVRSMAVASHAQRYCGVDVLLHLTCTGMTKDQLAAVLRQAKR